MTIRNFGGQEVNVICQVAIILACGKFKCRTTVLVQKGTTLEMLLGTDVFGQLGFQVLQVQDDGKGLELLSQNKQELEEKKQLHEQKEDIQMQKQEKEVQILEHIGGGNRGPQGPWPLLNLRPLHRIAIFAIENHFSLAKWPPLL